MDALDELERRLTEREERLRRWREAWLDGPTTPTYRLFVLAWGVVVLARASMVPHDPAGWVMSTGLLAVCALGLLRWGGRCWWLVSAVALAWPLLLLRDWMTQSVALIVIAVVGAATAYAGASGRQVRDTAWLLTISVYTMAVFHKLNSGFFDPNTSCANYGLDKLHRFVGISGGGGGVEVAWTIIVAEVIIGVLLLTRPRGAIVLGALFHVPLTMVLAPTFAFVMWMGYVAALGDEDLSVVTALPRRWVAGAIGVGICVGGFVAVVGPTVDLVLGVKTVLLVGSSGVAALAIHAAGFGRARTPSRGALALSAGFLLWCMTPYGGTQFQHTGAMLSNLRVDEGCWNHWLVPESVRILDPYVRIDEASLGAGNTAGHFPDTEETLRSTLWNTTALGRMRVNWCTERTRPITLVGSYRGAPLRIDDLCDPETPLPEGPGVFGGSGWFPNYLRLQANLERRCPAMCVH